MDAAVQFGLDSPFPEPEAATNTSTPRRRRPWHERFPTSLRSTRRSSRRWPATTRVVFYGQDVAPTDEDPLVKAFGRDRVRVSPISETAEIGMAVGLALAGYRPVVELLMAEFMLVAMNQVVNEAPAPALHERRPGQGPASAQGRLRLHRRMGRPAHRLHLHDVRRHPGAEGGRCRRRPPTPRD